MHANDGTLSQLKMGMGGIQKIAKHECWVVHQLVVHTPHQTALAWFIRMRTPSCSMPKAACHQTEGSAGATKRWPAAMR